MPIGVALIAGAAGLGAAALSSKGRTSNVERDQRETSIEQMFSSSFLESLTTSERTALETQISSTQESTTGVTDITQAGEAARTETGETTSLQTGQATSTETGVSDILRGSESSQAAIESLLSGVNAPSGEAAIQASIARVLKSGAPVIAGAGNRAGSFDSTVQAQLQNDLIIQAAQAGATTDLAQQNTNVEQLLAAITASQAAQEAQQRTSTGQETSVTAGQEATTGTSLESTTGTSREATAGSTIGQAQATTAVDETTQVGQSQAQTQEQGNISDIFTDVQTGTINTINTTSTPLDVLLANRGATNNAVAPPRVFDRVDGAGNPLPPANIVAPTNPIGALLASSPIIDLSPVIEEESIEGFLTGDNR